MKRSLILTLLIIFYLVVSGVSSLAMDYKHNLKAEDMSFSWTLEGDIIHIELAAKTTGWVGIGFNPKKFMGGSNIIIGAVKNGKVKIQDHFANRDRGHTADTKEGGIDNVKNPMGSETEGITTISFTLPLSASEKFDTNIKADGTDIIMLAYGAGRDSFNGRHPFRAVYKVNLKTGENKKVK
jgi:hypothetical protein